MLQLRFFEDLTSKLHQLDRATIPEPPGELADGEIVVGILPDELRAFWGLRQSSFDAEAALRQRVTAMLGGEYVEISLSREQQALRDEYTKLRTYLHDIDRVFWAALRHEFPMLVGKDYVGLRKKWRVVWFKESEPEVLGMHVIEISLGPSRPGFLDMILGRRRPR